MPMANDMDMKTAIQTGDAAALRRLLTEDASRANGLIDWGKNACVHTHPLHFVSDMLFDGTLAKGKELPLIDALISAGADLDFQRDREDGRRATRRLSALQVSGLRRWGSGCWRQERGQTCADSSERPRSTGQLFLARTA